MAVSGIQLVEEGLAHNSPTLVSENGDAHPNDVPIVAVQLEPGGFRFWMVFIALMMSAFLYAMEGARSTTSTALPRIVEELHGENFVWVGTAYTLGSAVVYPLSAGLAQIFGRRPVLLCGLILFAIGSGICGGAMNMNMLIAGRAVLGVGGGFAMSLSEIIISDLVPLSKRGTYMGGIFVMWGLSSVTGPIIGGALAKSNWRWIFYMNLPPTGIAIVQTLLFLDLKTPTDDLATKLRRMDWFGNFLLIGSTTLLMIALTWAGVYYPWSSSNVLAPLVIGLVGLGISIYYEAKWAAEPVIPWTLINNRTGAMGYIANFMHAFVFLAILYYLPVYFQGSLGQSALRSGTSILGLACVVPPVSIVVGLSVTSLKKYKPQTVTGFALFAIGIGLFTLLKADSPKGQWIGFQIPAAVGLAIVQVTGNFPVMAAAPVAETPHALALLQFVRALGYTWGISIGATILQNELQKRLPTEFLQQLSDSSAGLAYAVVPAIPGLAKPLRSEVQSAFAGSIRTIWYTLLGVTGIGLVAALIMKELPMHEVVDEKWGMEELDRKQAVDDTNVK